jgi:hypothetical protein
MPTILETLQPNIDTLVSDGDDNVKAFAQQVATLATAYDSGSFTKLPEYPATTDADILKAVFSKSLIDAQESVEASSETVATAATEIHSVINSLS